MDTDALATKPDGLAGRAAKSCIDRLNLLLRGETCRSNSKTDSDARNDRRSLEKAQVIENGQLLRSADHSIPVPSSLFPAILSRLHRVHLSIVQGALVGLDRSAVSCPLARAPSF